MFERLRFAVCDGTMELFGKDYTLGQLSTDVLNITPSTLRALEKQCSAAEAALSAYTENKTNENWRAVLINYKELDRAINRIPVLKILNVSHEPPRSRMSEEDYRWMLCLFFKKYGLFLSDIKAFNITIGRFISHFVIHLKNVDKENIAEEVYNFFTYYGDLTANAMNSDAVYTQTDEVSLQFYPRETTPGSGEYKLFEYYISDRLQAFLKIDFYKAIGYGYHVRRCAYCGRYFLSKRNYHTKYCDYPSPDNPNLTCVQLGYHYLKKKERADDNPKTQSLRRCDQRIIKDCSRGVITKDEEERLREKARKLYYAAATSPGTSNEAFEEMLRSENLYPLCGVRKKTKRRGRPKKI